MSEYRLCWSASSNISFQGATDWEEWSGDEDDDIEGVLTGGKMNCEGLSMVLDASGFEWWVEVRDV